MKTGLIYHLLIDRFFPSGTPDNNGNFKGGKISDVIKHLDYIRNLGMSGVMINPFYRNAAYHGYHIVDFNEVDPHFGTWEDISELVNEAHRRNMVIIADFVTNHCHALNSLFTDKMHDKWFLTNSDGSHKTYAGIDRLPMFDTDNAEVRKFLVDQAMKLCDIGFDALRLDHATGPSYEFWQYFTTAVKRSYPRVSLIGEVWGKMDFRPRNKLRYIYNSLRYSPQEARQIEYAGIFDGILDFRYRELLINAIHKQESLTKTGKLYGKVKRHFNRYPSDFQLWLFLDNHDLNRIMFECGFDKTLVESLIRFTEQWEKPFLMFYGTETNMTNIKSISDNSPYADERVRQILT